METTTQNRTVPAPIVFVNYHGTMGGGQIHLLTIIDGLDRSRFEPHVVCCQDGLFAEQLRSRGITPKLIPFGKGKLRYLSVSLPAIWTFFKYLKEISAGMVHVSGLQEAKLAARACTWAKIPMVWLVAP
jgi:Glycosyltransferase Family 4